MALGENGDLSASLAVNNVSCPRHALVWTWWAGFLLAFTRKIMGRKKERRRGIPREASIGWGKGRSQRSSEKGLSVAKKHLEMDR